MDLNHTLLSLNGRDVTPLALLWALVAFALVMGLALVAAGLMRKRLFGRGHGNPSTEKSVIKSLLVGAALFGFVIALRATGLLSDGALIFLGFVTLAIALAARHAVANCIAGLTLLYERSLSVGDHVQIGADRGEIEAIRLKSTYVTTASGARLVMPNALLSRMPVTNLSAPDGRIRLRLPVVLAHGGDAGEAIMALRKVAERNARVRKNPAPRSFLTGIDPAGLHVELWAWVGDPSDAPYVENDLYRGIQSELARARIALAGTETAHGRPVRGRVRTSVAVEEAEPPGGDAPAAQPSRPSEPARDGDSGGGSRRERTRSRRSRRGDEGGSDSRSRTDRSPERRRESRSPEAPAREAAPAEPEFSFESTPEQTQKRKPEPQPQATQEPSSESTPEPSRTSNGPANDFYLGDPGGEQEERSPASGSRPRARAEDRPVEETPAPEEPKQQTFGRGRRKIPRR